MQIPSITTKTWTGAQDEYFTYEDMNRVCSNVNALAEAILGESEAFPSFDHTSQFDYSVANAIESTLKRMSRAIYRDDNFDTSWATMHTVSFVDFDRWENGSKVIHDAAVRKKTVTIISPADMPDADWILSDSTRTIASGHGILTSQTFDLVEQGAAVLSVSQYGLNRDITLSIGDSENQTISIASELCKLSVISSCKMDQWTINNYASSAVDSGNKTGVIYIIKGTSVSVSGKPLILSITGGGSKDLVHSVVGGPMEGASSKYSTRQIKIDTVGSKTVSISGSSVSAVVPVTTEPIAYRVSGVNTTVTIPEGVYVVAAIGAGSYQGGNVVLQESMELDGAYAIQAGVSSYSYIRNNDGVVLSTQNAISISTEGYKYRDNEAHDDVIGYAGKIGVSNKSLRDVYPRIAEMLEQFYPGHVDSRYSGDAQGLSATTGTSHLYVMPNGVQYHISSGGGGIAGGDGGSAGKSGMRTQPMVSVGEAGAGGLGYGAGGGGPKSMVTYMASVFDIGGFGGGGGIGTEKLASAGSGAPGAIWLMWIADI